MEPSPDPKLEQFIHRKLRELPDAMQAISVLSFVALGLGLFWAGWTQDKQSWHDRIADTLIVRLPKTSPGSVA